MAADQLEGGPLRLPLCKKGPPPHPARRFPSGGLGIVVMKNYPRRIRNRKRRNGLVCGRPTHLPGRELDQLTLVIAIPNLGAGKYEAEPDERRPWSREHAGRSRGRVSRNRVARLAFPKPPQTEHAGHAANQGGSTNRIVPFAERVQPVVRSDKNQGRRPKDVANKNPATAEHEKSDSPGPSQVQE